MKILVINPGSTSTKISLFENRKELFTSSVVHDAPMLLSFNTTNDQLDFRKEVTLKILSDHGYSIASCDIFVARGGSAHSQKAGLTVIDEALYLDTKNEVDGTDHPSKLGVMLAYLFGQKYNKPAFTLNPINLDEIDDKARITGIKGVYRRPQTHALNQKATVAMHAEKTGKKLDDSSYICVHIAGGISIAAHLNGRMIDSNEGAGGDGPFAPTRIGSIPVIEVVRYLEEGHTIEELKRLSSKSGGFVSYFGTSEASKVYKMAEEGNEEAKLVWEAMLYQICKAIGSMAAALSGKVNNIILTGGLVRYPSLVEYITSHCSFIAPVVTYPGEIEQEALAFAVCDWIDGKEEAHKYIPRDVFEGFDWD